MAKLLVRPVRVEIDPIHRVPDVLFGIFTWDSGQMTKHAELPIRVQEAYSANESGLAVSAAARILRADLLDVVKELETISKENETS